MVTIAPGIRRCTASPGASARRAVSRPQPSRTPSAAISSDRQCQPSGANALDAVDAGAVGEDEHRGSGARDDGGVSRSAQRVDEVERLRHRRAPVLLVEPVAGGVVELRGPARGQGGDEQRGPSGRRRPHRRAGRSPGAARGPSRSTAGVGGTNTTTPMPGATWVGAAWNTSPSARPPSAHRSRPRPRCRGDPRAPPRAGTRRGRGAGCDRPRRAPGRDGPRRRSRPRRSRARERAGSRCGRSSSQPGRLLAQGLERRPHGPDDEVSSRRVATSVRRLARDVDLQTVRVTRRASSSSRRSRARPSASNPGPRLALVAGTVRGP